MQITSGKIESAQKVLVYGPEGIGKSTFAAQFPDPLFIDVEGSTKHLDVKRLDTPESWNMLLEEVRFVLLNPSCCKTLVIDTVDWAELLCITQVCAKAQKDGIEDFGYGKGYTYLAEEFGHLLNLLTEVVDKGIHVVLTAHTAIRKFEQPDETAAYDRWELKLQKKTSPLVREWCDMVLFANYKTFVVKSEDGKPKANGGHRVLYTSHRPTWDAKNRHGLADEIPFEYAAIAEAIAPGKISETSVKELSTSPTVNAGPSIQESVAPAPEPAESADEPAYLKKLHQLMSENGVSDEELRNTVGFKGYYPAATPIETYDPKFVEGALIAAWPKVLETINELKTVPIN